MTGSLLFFLPSEKRKSNVGTLVTNSYLPCCWFRPAQREKSADLFLLFRIFKCYTPIVRVCRFHRGHQWCLPQMVSPLPRVCCVPFRWTGSLVGPSRIGDQRPRAKESPRCHLVCYVATPFLRFCCQRSKSGLAITSHHILKSQLEENRPRRSGRELRYMQTYNTTDATSRTTLLGSGTGAEARSTNGL